MSRTSVRAAWAAAIVCLLLSAAQAQAVTREIEHLQGDVYRFRNDRHYSVFVVSDEGVIAADPINRDAARWLRDQIRERFDREVRYLIYSHNHSDHVYGGEVFADAGATVVSHHLARQDLVRTRAETALPSITFREQMCLELGEKNVVLRYHGPADGRGTISMTFEPEGVVYVADWIVLGRMPWQKLWSYDIFGMINATREVEALSFEFIAPAHGDTGDKADVASYRRYLESLLEAVVDHINAGQSLEHMKKEIRLEEWSHLRHYEEWLPLNVEGVYDHLMNRSGMSWRP